MARNRSNLRSKIIAWSFVPTVIILVAVAWVNFASYQRVTEDLVIERDRELNRLLAERLADELSRYSQLLSDVARLPEICEGQPAEQRAALIAAQQRLRAFDAGMVVLDAQGLVVASAPERPDLVARRDWSDRAYFQRVRDLRAPAFSDITVDGPAGSEVIVAAAPIIDYDQRFRGALAGMFRLGMAATSDFYGGILRQVGKGANPPEEAFFFDESNRERGEQGVLGDLNRLLQQPRLVSLELSGQGSAYLVDGSGRIIYHSGMAHIGDRITGQVAVHQVLAGRSGAVRTRDLYGQEIVASFAPVPGAPWGLITEESWASLIGASERERRFLLALLALGVVLPVLVATIGVRRITKPIAQLTDAAQRVAAGNLDQTIVVSSRDELATLAEQFNVMAARLHESYAHLEQRVTDRTRALATLNAVALQVSQSLDLQQIMRDALREAMGLVGAAAGAALVARDDGSLRLIAHDGLVSADALAGLCAPADGELTRQFGASAEPRLWAASNSSSSVWVWATQERLNILVSAPLATKGRLLGAILLGWRQPQVVSAETLTLLSAIGRQVGMAVENAQLYEQAQQVAALAERQRLARDLHDSVAQSLYGATLYARAASRLLAVGDAAQANQHLDELQQIAQEALQEMRLLIFELRPSVVAEEGLAAALAARLEAVEGRAGLETTLRVEGDICLPAPVEDGLYRIAQEAMNNVLKHAHAQHIAVTLSQRDRHVTLQVTDDGGGFDPSVTNGHRGLGLRTMRERAEQIGAQITVQSKPGEGVVVSVEIEL